MERYDHKLGEEHCKEENGIRDRVLGFYKYASSGMSISRTVTLNIFSAWLLQK